MSMIGKWIRARRRENLNGMPDTHEVTLRKAFDTADYTPVEYRHTEKFYEDGLDPLSYEKRRLDGMSTSWLMQDKRIPAIQADSRREIRIGERQYINHIYTIQTIIDLQRGDVVHAQDTISRIDEEIAAYDAEEERLNALMNA